MVSIKKKGKKVNQHYTLSGQQQQYIITTFFFLYLDMDHQTF